MKTINELYDSQLGTVVANVESVDKAIEFIISHKFRYFIISTPARTEIYFDNVSLIEMIKRRDIYASIIHIITVNEILIVEY